ncbi:MAG: putative 3,8-cyclase [Thermoproteota archaeon]|nr:putative 3,8-cyclase [Thermoproteota archaeon]
MINDPYGRPISNLRMSITQRCDLNCFYCHKEGENYKASTEMTPEEIERVTKIVTSFGLRNVKLTGGEPLLRREVVEIVRRVSSIPLVREVAITTNGHHLKRLAKELKENGLKRVNVSLATLKPETYTTITGIDVLNQVIEGVKEASKVGLSPIKINMVVLKGINEDHIWSMIDFAKKNGFILQLIEFESPNDEDENYKKFHSDLAGIEAELKKAAERTTVRRMQNRRKYFLGSGEVEVVRPMHNSRFCSNCTRLRITSDGKFKPCLFRTDNLINFLTPMRAGASDEDLKQLFMKAVENRRPFFT